METGDFIAAVRDRAVSDLGGRVGTDIALRPDLAGIPFFREWPADEWLHARIEGHAFMDEMARHMLDLMKTQGFTCIAPSLDPRFSTKSPVTEDKTRHQAYTSN
jgi:hypothetical protein